MPAPPSHSEPPTVLPQKRPHAEVSGTALHQPVAAGGPGAPHLACWLLQSLPPLHLPQSFTLRPELLEAAAEAGVQQGAAAPGAGLSLLQQLQQPAKVQQLGRGECRRAELDGRWRGHHSLVRAQACEGEGEGEGEGCCASPHGGSHTAPVVAAAGRPGPSAPRQDPGGRESPGGHGEGGVRSPVALVHRCSCDGSSRPPNQALGLPLPTAAMLRWVSAAAAAAGAAATASAHAVAAAVPASAYPTSLGRGSPGDGPPRAEPGALLPPPPPPPPLTSAPAQAAGAQAAEPGAQPGCGNGAAPPPPRAQPGDHEDQPPTPPLSSQLHTAVKAETLDRGPGAGPSKRRCVLRSGAVPQRATGDLIRSAVHGGTGHGAACLRARDTVHGGLVGGGGGGGGGDGVGGSGGGGGGGGGGSGGIGDLMLLAAAAAAESATLDGTPSAHWPQSSCSSPPSPTAGGAVHQRLGFTAALTTSSQPAAPAGSLLSDVSLSSRAAAALAAAES
ncbi:hypothetical protein HYH03_014033 [Edaphochlamys debaryana]|uniref:Uncharacterized protein n=1 Tax=Edaphochlamys debaryana TaxID=47281 RepID=A0A836BSB7_9CHLO|nr:hypothetical protein HYH03_014033 [Edaphochlamys debaryana]|eukprot:KAG2487316.1 hypothetical protein HYH03_014033 [Edaphochlamys debaryana]